MNKKKFEYFLNAVHYYICKAEVWLDHLIDKKMYKCVHVIYRAFGWESKYYKRIDELGINTEYQNYKLGKNGPSILWGHYWFYDFCFGYGMLPSFVLIGFIFREPSELNFLLALIVLEISIILGYITANKAVFSNDRYLKYFKKFEKEDEQWHRKWKRRTIAFCFGSIIVVLIGICLAFAIATSK